MSAILDEIMLLSFIFASLLSVTEMVMIGIIK